MIKEVIMYTVICDNCGKNSGDGQDFAAWGDKQWAEDTTIDTGWVEHEGKHYCDDCYFYNIDDELILKTNTI